MNHKHIFIKQVSLNNVFLERVLYSKDQTIIHHFTDDNDFESKIYQEQIDLFTHYFFKQNTYFFHLFRNDIFYDIINYEKTSWSFDSKDRINSCEHFLYGIVYIDYNDNEFPVKIYTKNLEWVLLFEYDDLGNIIVFNDNDVNIYKYEYVFYEDIYKMLNLNSILK